MVDLDGTLIRSDLLHESFWEAVAGGIAFRGGTLRALLAGKAPLKHWLARSSTLDYASLPYDLTVLRLIEQARAEGRAVYLATASNRRHAEAIGRHLGLFAGIFASDERTNLKGAHKAARLVAAFGERGFDYLGDSAADLPVWAAAGTAYVLRAGPSLARRVAARRPDAVHVGEAPASWRSPAAWRLWARAIRVHQYVKNTLVFVPVLTAHLFTPDALAKAVLAFLAFCACASAVYLLNDCLDLKSDRAHPTKRSRPLASGRIGIGEAMLAIPLLLAAALLAALMVSLPFAGVLAGYLALTTAYSFWLKRKMLVDIVVLALLYTVRVIGGAAAIAAPVSEWLLIFSLMMFTALALIKRYTELAQRFDAGLGDPLGRNYQLGDLNVIAALAAAAGMNVVTIFALYLSSSSMQALYTRPGLLWLMCPILLYWIARALLMAHRRLMHDDPIVFALRDRVSRIAIACMIALVAAAI